MTLGVNLFVIVSIYTVETHKNVKSRNHDRGQRNNLSKMPRVE